MRCDQFAGLPNRASVFLRENLPEPRKCECCGQAILGDPPPVIGHFTGMFGDEYPLCQYTLSDGRLGDVFWQETTWSSGAVHFLGLQVSDGAKFEWSKEEMEKW